MDKLSIDDVNDLVKEATEARESAYAPYSGYKVGAAVLTKSGRTYPGANVERVTHDATHAERYAVDSAVLAGERDDIIAIAIVTDDPTTPYPCGKCRQDLREINNGDLEIIAANLSGTVRRTTLKELLPDCFGPDNLSTDDKRYGK